MSEWIANFLGWLLDFSNILNASIAASWMVLAVIVLRFLLKKAPRWIHVALWGLVAVRLLLPFSIESPLSLIPSAETIPHELLRVEGTQLQEPAYLDVVSNPIFSNGASVEIGQTIDRVQINMMLMTLIWLIGIAVLLVYTIISYWCLRRKVSEAVILRDNIFQSENAGSPFVLGIIKPRIYLPYKIEEQTLVHVIAHEQAHIQRKDHWWKPLGFLLLTIHWFNPLMWLGYVLLCRDIELACDEKVIKDIDNEQRADYSQALVACSVKRPMIAACPLAFGEVGVKERVRSVLNYKKPAFWIIAVAVVACIVVGVCFLTNPSKDKYSEEATPSSISFDGYSAVEVLYMRHDINYSMITQKNIPFYTVTEDMKLMSKGEYSPKNEWTNLGTLTDIELTKENFDELFLGKWLPLEDGAYYRKNNAHAWYVIYQQDILYYVLFQKNGEVLLANGYYDYLEKNDSHSDDSSIKLLYRLGTDIFEDTDIENDAKGSIQVSNEADHIDNGELCVLPLAPSEYHDLTKDGSLEITEVIKDDEIIVFPQTMSTNKEQIAVTNKSDVDITAYLYVSDDDFNKAIREVIISENETKTFTGLTSRFNYRIGVSVDASAQIDLIITD